MQISAHEIRLQFILQIRIPEHIHHDYLRAEDRASFEFFLVMDRDGSLLSRIDKGLLSARGWSFYRKTQFLGLF